MNTKDSLKFTAIALVALALVVVGWREFMFLTDDSFIAFRYVRNSQLGHGYVWNPAPFHPVDGYTSFAWVVLMDFLWTLTGFEPPQIAPWATLGFSVVTLLIFIHWGASLLPSRVRAPKSPVSARTGYTALAFATLGLVTNRTFLTWTSGGLEAPMFCAIVTAWAFRGCMRGQDLIWAGLAALAALTRPEGLLIWALTVGVMSVDAGRRWWKCRVQALSASSARVSDGALVRSPDRGDAVQFAVAVAPVAAHAAWHRATYGAWLPNTYYAKVGGWDYQHGWKYVMSFAIEYGVWPSLVLTMLAGAFYVRRQLPSLAQGAVVAFYLGLVSYYGLRAGGDHFEFKAFLVVIPVLWMATLWALLQLVASPLRLVLALQAVVILSWPVQWMHHAGTRGLTKRSQTFKMHYQVASALPAGTPTLVIAYLRAFDELQGDLVSQHYGSRHREHEVFYHRQTKKIPLDENGSWNPLNPDVMIYGCVGILGWRFPHVAIIDKYGLNDRIVALNKSTNRKRKALAHSCVPPRGYAEAFEPNVKIRGKKVIRTERAKPLTPERIHAAELAGARAVGLKRWREQPLDR